jgi:uncharacterized protein (UPF0264 family)
METALLIVLPILTAGLTIASFFIARAAEIRKKGTDDGSLKADIQYIKEKVTELCKEQERINATLTAHFERIIRNEESIKSAHKRLDEMTNKKA